MTSTTDGAARRLEGSILVMSPSPQVAATVGKAFPEGRSRVKVEPAQVAALNGQATRLASRHDVVIFEARPGDRAEFDAISMLVAARPAGTLFVALAEGDLSIAEARKLREAGVGEVLPDTIGGPELRQAIDGLLAARRAPDETEAQGTLIAVAQARGGIGSTTVAVNLARRLMGGGGFFRSAPRRRVALLDLDLQFGAVASFLDLDGKSGLMEIIEAQHAPEPVLVREALQAHSSGLQVLSAPASLVPLNALTPETVGAVVHALCAQHDHVVVDLPRALVEWVAPVLRRATAVAMVTDTSVPSIRQAKRLIEFYGEDQPDLHIEMVVNRERRPLMKSAEVKEAELVLGRPLAHWLPDAPKEARRAADAGRPVIDLYPRSALGRAFGKLAEAMASIPAAKQPSA